MKLLIITGSLFPILGHNANLICKLLPFFCEHCEVRLLSLTSAEEKELPTVFKGVPCYWVTSEKRTLISKLFYSLVSKMLDPNGYSDAVGGLMLAQKAKEIRKEYNYDVILCSTEPFIAAVASALIPKDVRKGLYIMDPPEKLWSDNITVFRSRFLRSILRAQDVIFTTKYVIDAFHEQGYDSVCSNVKEVSFPMIEKHELKPTPQDISMDHTKINLLYCGALSKYLKRSPQFFLDVAAGLDDRFCLYFIGKFCDTLEKEFDFHTNAQIVTLPQQPYQTALNAMQNADVLVNIGNDVRIHLPSKIIEYISMQKPIVNFYKFDECPSLDFTSRAPVHLDISEHGDVEIAIEQLKTFCIKSKNKQIGWDEIEEQFSDCSPSYIATQILESLEI